MSSRSDQFFSDVDKAMSLSTQYGWPFMHFMLHDTTLTFTCQHDQDGPKEYSLCISPDDYPQNSVLTDHAKNETTNLVHKPIHVLLLQLRDELFCKQKKESTENDTDIGYNRLNREESDDSDYKECVSGGDDDDDDEDYDGYYVMEDHLNDEIENDQEAAESEKINSHLAEDMDKVHLLYGDDSLSYRLLESIGEIDVEMNIPISFLYADTAEAWNLDLHKPLTVRLHLSSVHYLDQKDPPDVEVFQPSRKGKFGLGCQLRK
ncbi:protein mono-ADP-ribosyltransferase PARP8-like [Gigantopelta aegis]|uniref:protein mono-ADP-ribosyltransferase PARP8-like n=1 Tax=Gigantopelta aegis TaxID=1735272 RepID=UPI001B887F46|nr:protein mono-ADP-ribosyltransferase PARP8-like [Gigantopelta aegis]